MSELFGVSSVQALTSESVNNLNLSRNLGISLTTTKIHSIAKKYFSVPTGYLSYYPSITGVVCPPEDETKCPGEPEERTRETQGNPSKKKSKKAPQESVGARHPRRPKKVVPPLANQPSIMTCFGLGTKLGSRKAPGT